MVVQGGTQIVDTWKFIIKNLKAACPLQPSYIFLTHLCKFLCVIMCSEGLYNIYFVFVGTVPIIRSPRGNAAEMVAEKLDKKLRENLRDTRNSLFLMDATSQGGGHFSFQRPLLIVLDRNVDMATPLHHTWTYQVFFPSLCQKNQQCDVSFDPHLI